MSTSCVVRLGVVGGRRGADFRGALAQLKNRVRLVAMCDVDEATRNRWRAEHSGIDVCADFDELLRRQACDALLLATPMQLHAQQAIAAMRAGCDVLCEVPACISREEAGALVETVERTHRTYMLAEGYVYRREHMMVQRMIDAGALGELTYAEGMYLHDCRELLLGADDALTWRGRLACEMPMCNYYPTHSLGPIARWMGLGRDDSIESVYCLATPALCVADYVRRRLGASYPGAVADYWHRGDGASCLLHTRRGRVIHLRTDTSSSRPHHMHSHELQGTRGCYRAASIPGDPPLVWLDRAITGANPMPKADKPAFCDDDPIRFESLWRYADRFEDPRWRGCGDRACQAGHGGGDFYVLEDFINAVQGRAANPIDVYDAVLWSSVIWLSAESVQTRRAVRAVEYRPGTQAGLPRRA